jgi:hypothetical protein
VTEPPKMGGIKDISRDRRPDCTQQEKYLFGAREQMATPPE